MLTGEITVWKTKLAQKSRRERCDSCFQSCWTICHLWNVAAPKPVTQGKKKIGWWNKTNSGFGTMKKTGDQKGRVALTTILQLESTNRRLVRLRSSWGSRKALWRETLRVGVVQHNQATLTSLRVQLVQSEEKSKVKGFSQCDGGLHKCRGKRGHPKMVSFLTAPCVEILVPPWSVECWVSFCG